MLSNWIRKWQWAVRGVGLIPALRGLRRLVGSSEMVTEEGIALAWGLGLRPNLLVVAGRYVEPEYAHLCPLVEGRTVVDVGAGIGTFSLFMAKAGARHVRAYEPVETQFAYLTLNIARNGMGRVIEPRVMALGDGLDRGGRRGRGLATRVQGWTTLDDEFPTQSIDLLKINVAGGEAMVLKGAKVLLRERRVRWLVVLDGVDVRELLPELVEYRFALPEHGRHWIGELR